MVYILIALIFFVLSVVAHVIFCRYRDKNKLWAKAFVGIALLNLFFAWLIFLGMPHLKWVTGIWNTPLLGTATFIYLLLIPSYLVFYVTTQLNSPTKTILVFLKKQQDASWEELTTVLTDEAFVLPRIKDLHDTGCIESRQGKWYLTSSGNKIAFFLKVYQLFLGRQKGG